MKESDLEVLERIAQFEDSTDREEKWKFGWSWRQVQVSPATLNRLCVEGYIREEFHSNAYTGYILTEKARALFQSMAEAESEEPFGKLRASPEPLAIPDDLFQDIIGHEGVKALLRACLLAVKPVHVLLVGPPALAKSLFLWELERVGGDRANRRRASSPFRESAKRTGHRPARRYLAASHFAKIAPK